MRFITKSKQALYALSAVLAVILGMGFQPVEAGSYHQLQVPNSKVTAANGINNLNEIVGFYFGQSGPIHGYLLSNGKYTNVDYPGATTTEVDGINDSGSMVGLYNTGGTDHGWILQNGTFTQIDYPGAADTVPMAINNSGEVVGNWDTGQPNSERAFKYVNGTFTQLNIPGAVVDGAAGVDTNGDISGFYQTSPGGPTYGFILRSSGQLVTIKDPAAQAATSGSGMNNKLQVVGSYLISNSFGNFEGFVWSSGKFANIMYPGSTTTYASAINDSGVLVGDWFNQTSFEEGFYYIP